MALYSSLCFKNWPPCWLCCVSLIGCTWIVKVRVQLGARQLAKLELRRHLRVHKKYIIQQESSGFTGFSLYDTLLFQLQLRPIPLLLKSTHDTNTVNHLYAAVCILTFTKKMLTKLSSSCLSPKPFNLLNMMHANISAVPGIRCDVCLAQQAEKMLQLPLVQSPRCILRQFHC